MARKKPADGSALRLIPYLRVSTDAQIDGYGIEVQEADIARWAARNGHVLLEPCSDMGVSGTVEALDREGLACVLDAIEQGEADGVVVAKLDRLARRLHVQEAALGHVWRLEGRAFAADTGEILQDDPDDPMRTAMRQMIGVFAELERAMIAKRLRDGRRLKAQKGGYIGGEAPFGWARGEDGALVEVAAEQAALALMRELGEQGLSLRAIGQELTKRGLPPRGGGDSWHPSTVQRALKRAGSPTSM